MYIAETDLLNHLDANDIAVLRRAADTPADQNAILNAAIMYACNFVRDRISHAYDLTAEFARAGDTRSTTLVDIVCDIAVWKLSKAFITVTSDGKKYTLYTDALKRLDDIERGRLTAGLTRLTETNGSKGTILFGTTENYVNPY
jgi:phage gp36-like protein